MNDQAFVDSSWLQQHLNDTQIRIIDARASDPRLPVGYRMGHIPNAIQLDLGRDLYEFKGRLPELKAPEQMAQVLGERGIANNHSVVIYDEATGQLVATIYWVMKYLGHQDVRVLQGGWNAWRAAGAPVSKDTPNFPPVTFRAQTDEAQNATADWIQENLPQPDSVLLDVRSEGEFAMGHIPGAVNWSYDRALDMRTQTLKDADDLKRQLAAVGVTPDKQVVVYCQSGARSSHSYLVVKSLGFPRVRNYKGSMIDWYQLRGLPLE